MANMSDLFVIWKTTDRQEFTEQSFQDNCVQYTDIIEHCVRSRLNCSSSHYRRLRDAGAIRINGTHKINEIHISDCIELPIIEDHPNIFIRYGKKSTDLLRIPILAITTKNQCHLCKSLQNVFFITEDIGKDISLVFIDG